MQTATGAQARPQSKYGPVPRWILTPQELALLARPAPMPAPPVSMPPAPRRKLKAGKRKTTAPKAHGARLAAEVSILEALRRDEQMPSAVRQLADRIGATRSTAHGALVSLIAAGSVIRFGDVLRAAA